VQVESEPGSRFILPEISPGIYQVIRPDLKIGSGYRLLIQTSAGQTFESDLVVLRQSPELSDVHWTHDGAGITVRVDSSDPSGETRYYQWMYTETWEYDADVVSPFVIRRGRPDHRTPEERIHICYSTQASSKVLVSTTSDQSGDVINDFPLVQIQGGSRKLSRTYSILVEQRALDEQSYQYWSQLQRTTENLGGLFDPLPSQVIGNIHSTQANGPVVLGYFNGGGVKEKRLFIHFSELPPELQYVNRRSCATDTIRTLGNYPDGSPLTNMDPPTIALTSDINLPWSICMDCRLDGGTTTKPAFWPY
jgi:hypothetical protein